MTKLSDGDETWEKIKDIIVGIQLDEIGKVKRIGNKKSITDEILDEMEHRDFAWEYLSI